MKSLKMQSPFFSKIALSLIFLLSFVLSLSAQRDTISFESVKDEKNYGRFRFIEIKGHSGYHLYTGELLNDAVNQGYGAVEFRYGWQPKDPDKWPSRYGYASYGFGYYSGFFTFNKKVIYLSKNNDRNSFLIRTAKTYGDFTGGQNYFVEYSNSKSIIMERFLSMLNKLTAEKRKPLNFGYDLVDHDVGTIGSRF